MVVITVRIVTPSPHRPVRQVCMTPILPANVVRHLSRSARLAAHLTLPRGCARVVQAKSRAVQNVAT